MGIDGIQTWLPRAAVNSNKTHTNKTSTAVPLRASRGAGNAAENCLKCEKRKAKELSYLCLVYLKQCSGKVQ